MLLFCSLSGAPSFCVATNLAAQLGTIWSLLKAANRLEAALSLSLSPSFERYAQYHHIRGGLELELELGEKEEEEEDQTEAETHHSSNSNNNHHH